MQQALFALGFGEEEEDEKERDRIIKTAEGMVDSVLRGTGIYGNIVMMAKNVAVDIALLRLRNIASNLVTYIIIGFSHGLVYFTSAVNKIVIIITIRSMYICSLHSKLAMASRIYNTKIKSSN